MRILSPFSITSCFLTLAIKSTQVYAWGAAGHEITATIAQMYLHPSVLPQICAIVYPYTPPKEPCHLAPIATWADRIRGLPQYRWASSYHYVGGIEDWPPSTCMFGEHGWEGREGVNVLAGLANTTRILRDSELTTGTLNQGGFERVSESLKFAIHFLGDLHQPLHLTARERGGNGIKVHFHHRITNLHSVWDSRLLSNGILDTPSNYTKHLPVPAVESALRGAIYDPYIRSIVWEGLMQKWKGDLQEWISCPSNSYERNTPQARFGQDNDDPAKWDDDFVCPYHWAKPNAALNCKIIFPPELDWPPNSNSTHEAIELDTPKYAGKIRKQRILERLLAQGGIRTAAILNGLFAPEEARASGYLLYPSDISL